MQSKSPPSIDSLRARLDELEAQSKALSRQIGAAKKSRSPEADNLIAQKKQLQTEQIAPLKAQIDALEKPSENQAQDKPNSKKRTSPESVKAPAPYPTNAPSAINLTQAEFVYSELGNEAGWRDKWDDYVKSHPQGSIYHTQAFLGAVIAAFSHKIFLLALHDRATNALLAVVPIVEQKSRLFGHLWTSIAFVNYGGILANNAEAEKQLTEAASTLADKCGVKRLEIRGLYERPDTGKNSHWRVSTEKASMWLPLPADHNSDTLLQQFKAKLRSQIKKGYTDDISSKVGGKELLEDFYQVFSRNMRDLGTPVYGRALFSALIDMDDKNTQIVVAYHQGKAASAAFLIQNRSIMEIPWASTIKEYNHLNLNMVLYWEVLKYACQQHCAIFDFGRSTINASTYKFKKQWGAQPIQHYWYSWEPQSSESSNSSEMTAVSTQNPKFQILIGVWKKLPLWLANLIGPFVVKYIP